MRRLALYQPKMTTAPSMFADFDHLFDSLWTQPEAQNERLWFLSADTQETDEFYKLSFDIPGVKKEDLKIEFQKGILTLSGERRAADDDKTGRVMRERVFGKFTRSFSLPEGVDADRIEAKYQDGVLEVTLPKAPETKAKAIPIN